VAIAEHQYAELRPPRRGLTMAIGTDNTARPYDLALLDLGSDGQPPDGTGDRPRFVNLWMQADTSDIIFYFSPTTQNDLTTTASVAAGSTTTPTYATTDGALLKAGNPPVYFRLHRTTDRWLIVRSAVAANLRIWAQSTDSF
jgi:hypothetical protein